MVPNRIARRKWAAASRLLAAPTAILAGLALCGCGGGEHAPAAQALPAPVQAQETGRALDLAIDGEGMFILSNAEGHAPVYSRRARFGLNEEGRLIDDQGRFVVGRSPYTPPGEAGPLPNDGPLPAVARRMPGRATTNVSATIQFGGAAVPHSDLFDAADPQTYDFATQTWVHDDEGLTFELALYFIKRAQDQWQVQFAANGVVLEGQSALLAFTLDGTLPAQQAKAAINLPALSTSSGLLVGPINGLVIDFSNSTQFRSHSSISRLTQDGYAIGALAWVSVSDAGLLNATYDNGQSRTLGRLLLAGFSVADRLEPRPGQAWACGAACSGGMYLTPGQYPVGLIRPGYLESAN